MDHGTTMKRFTIPWITIETHKQRQHSYYKGTYKYHTDMHTVNTLNPTRVKNYPEPGIEPKTASFQAVVCMSYCMYVCKIFVCTFII